MKAIDATCVAGVVTAQSIPVEATVISEGVKSSDGVLLLDEDRAIYLTSNAEDIKDLITNIGDVLTKIITIATGLDAASNAPGGQTANIATLTSLKATLIAQKEALK